MNSVICPECGKESDDTVQICIGCGLPFSKTVICHECKRTVLMDAEACPFCGFPIRKKEKRKKAVKVSLSVGIPAIVMSLMAVLLSVCIIGGAVTINAASNKKIETDLIAESPIYLVNSNARVIFRDDGTMVYFNFFIEDNDILENGFELSSAVAKFKVKGKNKLKINGKTVEYTIRDDGKILFEPDITTVLADAEESE